MKLNRLQVASILLLFALFTVPSFAFPNESGSGCYQATLTDGENNYGLAKFRVVDNHAQLMIEIEGFPQSGEFDVALFKDYYSDFISGSIKLVDGKGEATFNIPYLDPDFQVIIDTSLELHSGEWMECEPPVKPDAINVSPSTLNLKSMGKWVTVTVRVSSDPMPTDFALSNGGSASIEPESIKITGDHITLKFSRQELQSICSPGNNELTLTFKIGEDNYELTDVITVIQHGSLGTSTVQNQNQNQSQSNNGKAKGKNKDN